MTVMKAATVTVKCFNFHLLRTFISWKFCICIFIIMSYFRKKISLDPQGRAQGECWPGYCLLWQVGGCAGSQLVDVSWPQWRILTRSLSRSWRTVTPTATSTWCLNSCHMVSKPNRKSDLVTAVQAWPRDSVDSSLELSSASSKVLSITSLWSSLSTISFTVSSKVKLFKEIVWIEGRF